MSARAQVSIDVMKMRNGTPISHHHRERLARRARPCEVFERAWMGAASLRSVRLTARMRERHRPDGNEPIREVKKQGFECYALVSPAPGTHAWGAQNKGRRSALFTGG